MRTRDGKETTMSIKALIPLVMIGMLVAPAAAYAQEEVIYFHTDAIGSVRATTNASGAVQGRYDYLPFGELWPSVPPPPVEVRQFAGKEREKVGDHDLDYFGARYHFPVTGRFTTVDPVLNMHAALSDPQRWNRYSYAVNNPNAFGDPDGRDVRPLDQLALTRIQSTVPEALRASIAIGANGLLDTAKLNAVKTKDPNFLDLLSLANASQLVEVATASSFGGVDFIYESMEAVRADLARLGVDPNVVSGPSLYLGQTSEITDGFRVTLSNGAGKAATAGAVELAVTTAHELYGHALPGVQGKPYKHDGGTLDRRVLEIEDRTRKMYEPYKQYF